MKTTTDLWQLFCELELYTSPSVNTKEPTSPTSLLEDLADDVKLDAESVEPFDELEELDTLTEADELEEELRRPENRIYYEDEDDEDELSYEALILDWYDEDDYNELGLENFVEEECDFTKADEAIEQKDAVIYFLQMKMDPTTMATTIYDPSTEEDLGAKGMYQEVLNSSL